MNSIQKLIAVWLDGKINGLSATFSNPIPHPNIKPLVARPTAHRFHQQNEINKVRPNKLGIAQTVRKTVLAQTLSGHNKIKIKRLSLVGACNGAGNQSIRNNKGPG